MTPLLDPVTAATPAVKVTLVGDPKLTALPEESVTVGMFPFGLADAPPNVRLTLPV
jgi:hypothetical protein